MQIRVVKKYFTQKKIRKKLTDSEKRVAHKNDRFVYIIGGLEVDASVYGFTVMCQFLGTMPDNRSQAAVVLDFERNYATDVDGVFFGWAIDLQRIYFLRMFKIIIIIIYINNFSLSYVIC